MILRLAGALTVALLALTVLALLSGQGEGLEHALAAYTNSQKGLRIFIRR